MFGHIKLLPRAGHGFRNYFCQMDELGCIVSKGLKWAHPAQASAAALAAAALSGPSRFNLGVVEPQAERVGCGRIALPGDCRKTFLRCTLVTAPVLSCDILSQEDYHQRFKGTVYQAPSRSVDMQRIKSQISRQISSRK